MNELIKKFRESCDYNIVLIGFMGAGKSTVARTLGEWFDMDIVEMDELISERQGMSIPEIFEKHGEEYFRNGNAFGKRKLFLEMFQRCGGYCARFGT